MVVVLANDLPPAVRGRMKLWFIEPRPNVFISGIKGSVAKTVVEFLYAYCPANAGVVIFRSLPEPPFYEVRHIGKPRKDIMDLSGFQLIIESSRVERTQDIVVALR